MSKLAEKLRQAAEGALQPMGFRAGTIAPTPSILLIVAIDQHSAVKSSQLSSDEVDGLLIITQDLERKNQLLQQMANASATITWGIWTKAVNTKNINQIIEAGGDTIVFEPATTHALLMQEKKVGKILKIEPPFDNNLITSIGNLPVDGVLIDLTAEGKKLTVSHLISCQWLIDATQKPLLVAVRGELSYGELKSLYETGVNGVIIVTEELDVEKIRNLKQSIKSLPTNMRSQKGRLPLLPYRDSEKDHVSSEEI